MFLFQNCLVKSQKGMAEPSLLEKEKVTRIYLIIHVLGSCSLGELSKV